MSGFGFGRRSLWLCFFLHCSNIYLCAMAVKVDGGSGVVYVFVIIAICNHHHHHHIPIHTTPSIHIHTSPPQKQPLHSASCMIASTLFAPVVEWKSTTSASCNLWQPPPVQVECLHQLKTPQSQGANVRKQGAKIRASKLHWLIDWLIDWLIVVCWSWSGQ